MTKAELLKQRGELAAALQSIMDAQRHSDTLLWSRVQEIRHDQRFSQDKLGSFIAELYK